jgi:uncharacterized damage-inducible protein DinB
MDYQKEIIAEYDREIAKTRKLLEAIPADVDFEYKPNPKSMSFGRLAGHIVETAGEWGKCTLTMDKMEMKEGQKYEPYLPKSGAEVVERLDKDTAGVKAALASFNPAEWDNHWKFIYNGQAFIDSPKHEVWRTWVISHMIHHRAQLGVYLRLLGHKIPGAYGPSADEGM